MNVTDDDVDFKKRILYVQPHKKTSRTWRFRPKDRDMRLLPLTDELIELLNTLPRPYFCLPIKRYEHLIRQDLSERICKCPASNFRRDFVKIRIRAGVPYGTFHDLRRTYITSLMENGLQPFEAQRLAGHSSVETTMGYAVTRDSLLSRARQAIGAVRFELTAS